MRRVATVCLAIGGAVAVLGVISLAVGFRPSALPPALLDIAGCKLVFIAAGGLIVTGAMLGRSARHAADRRESHAPPDRLSESFETGTPHGDSPTREQVPERVHRAP